MGWTKTDLIYSWCEEGGTECRILVYSNQGLLTDCSYR